MFFFKDEGHLQCTCGESAEASRRGEEGLRGTFVAAERLGDGSQEDQEELGGRSSDDMSSLPLRGSGGMAVVRRARRAPWRRSFWC